MENDVVALAVTAIFSPLITWALKKIPGTKGLTAPIHTIVCCVLYLGWITWAHTADHLVTPEVVEQAVIKGMATSAAVMSAFAVGRKALNGTGSG